MSTVLERVKAEGILDVFQTVKSLRLQRPHMVQTLVCYHVFIHVNTLSIALPCQQQAFRELHILKRLEVSWEAGPQREHSLVLEKIEEVRKKSLGAGETVQWVTTPALKACRCELNPQDLYTKLGG